VNNAIPTYQLHSFTGPAGQPAEFFFLGPESARPHLPINAPYRSGYYKIGLFLQGRAQLNVNLDTYDLGPGSLMALPPAAIKQWLFMADNHESLSVFFTRDFVAANGGPDPARFAFFDSDARHVWVISPAQAATLTALLHNIQEKDATPHAYRTEILRSLLHILLHETAAIYSQSADTAPAASTRSQTLAKQFKQLVNRHAAHERGLAFYAEQLCITPKHLAETVKEATGKRAVEWIAEAVILEAKVLLHNPNLTVAQTADLLHFADQSGFGRFFKSNTGLSPAAYRQRG
jgi:AraC family transcriptional activator of pobA